MTLPMIRVANQVGSTFLSKNLIVLAYHGIDDPDSFERQMKRLTELRTPVSLRQVERFAVSGESLPPRSVLVTFDDGDRSILDAGVEILERHGVPAVSFVVSDLIGTDDPFWWDEVVALVAAGGDPGVDFESPTSLVRSLKLVRDDERREQIDRLRASAAAASPRRRQLTPAELRELERRGVAIGSHTASHPCLDQCTGDAVAEELSRSSDQLTEYLGHRPSAFAYPNGNVTEAVSAAVADAGYDVAFLFDHRWCRRSVDRFNISRIRVDSTTALDRFDLLVSGVHSFQHRLRRRR